MPAASSSLDRQLCPTPPVSRAQRVPPVTRLFAGTPWDRRPSCDGAASRSDAPALRRRRPNGSAETQTARLASRSGPRRHGPARCDSGGHDLPARPDRAGGRVQAATGGHSRTIGSSIGRIIARARDLAAGSDEGSMIWTRRTPAMTVHAMPVMLGVLAILAIAYRYYSAFLAARVAVLDDSRVTPAHRFNDGQNFDPTNRWVLFGHHFAAISGAGPLIGPVLAIQFGYLPGLIWLVVGVCLAGAVQDMMVLAASTRRGGLSLAGLARDRDRPARRAGRGDRHPLHRHHRPGRPGDRGRQGAGRRGGADEGRAPCSSIPTERDRSRRCIPDGPTIYHVPAGLDLSVRRRAGPERWSSTRRSTWRCPRGSTSRANPDGKGWSCPSRRRRLVPGSSWGTFTIACTIPIALFVGWYMYRFRKGQGRRGVARSARRRVLAATVGRRLDPRLAARAVLLAVARPDDLRAGRLRVRRRGAAGLAPALPARLSVELPQDRHDRAAGRRAS